MDKVIGKIELESGTFYAMGDHTCFIPKENIESPKVDKWEALKNMMNKAEIEELLMCISTTSGYTENGDRTLSCNEVGQILDYINNLEEQIRDDI